jgi:hypothetical protein
MDLPCKDLVPGEELVVDQNGQVEGKEDADNEAEPEVVITREQGRFPFTVAQIGMTMLAASSSRGYHFPAVRALYGLFHHCHEKNMTRGLDDDQQKRRGATFQRRPALLIPAYR